MAEKFIVFFSETFDEEANNSRNVEEERPINSL